MEKNKRQKKVLLQEKTNFITTILNMKEIVTLLNSKLEGIAKSVRMLNFGFDTLDKILGVGKVARDMKGVTFNYNSMNAETSFFLLS